MRKKMIVGALAGSLLASLAALANRQDAISSFRDNIQRLRGDDSYSNKTHFSLGALAGTLLGAGVALLFTTKFGKKIRSKLENGYHDAADRTNEVIHFISDNGHHPRKVASYLNGKIKRPLKKALTKSTSRKKI